MGRPCWVKFSWVTFVEFICAEAAGRLARMNKIVDEVTREDARRVRNIGTSQQDLERRRSDALISWQVGSRESYFCPRVFFRRSRMFHTLSMGPSPDWPVVESCPIRLEPHVFMGITAARPGLTVLR